jgi:hypothetical protein
MAVRALAQGRPTLLPSDQELVDTAFRTPARYTVGTFTRHGVSIIEPAGRGWSPGSVATQTQLPSGRRRAQRTGWPPQLLMTIAPVIRLKRGKI